MYQSRMMGYYPKVIQSILEFQAIIGSESPEFTELSSGRERIIVDAYLLTMSEERIAQWEKVFNIRPIEGSTIEDRRETIIARIRSQSKLNTSLIKTIVKTFTGADCKSRIEDGVLYVQIYPSRNSKEYQLDNLTQELRMKLPSHIGLDVSKAWQYWKNINENYQTWGAVRTIYSDWESVLFDFQDKPNQLDYSTLDSFHLG